MWAKSEQAKSEQAKSEQAKSEQAKSEQAKSEQLKFPQITASSMELFFDTHQLGAGLHFDVDVKNSAALDGYDTNVKTAFVIPWDNGWTHIVLDPAAWAGLEPREFPPLDLMSYCCQPWVTWKDSSLITNYILTVSWSATLQQKKSWCHKFVSFCGCLGKRAKNEAAAERPGLHTIKFKMQRKGG